MFSMILRLLYVYCIVVMMRSRIFLISAFLSVSLPQSTSRHKRMSFFPLSSSAPSITFVDLCNSAYGSEGLPAQQEVPQRA